MEARKINSHFIYNDGNMVKAFDHKKKSIIKAFLPYEKQKKREDGKVIFTYTYEPILSKEEYLDLLDFFRGANIFKKMYAKMCQLYKDNYQQCYSWYFLNCKVKDVFNYELHLKKLKDKKKYDNGCPILVSIEKENIGNVNFYSHLKKIIQYSLQKNIDSVDELISIKQKGEKFPTEYTPLGKPLVNSVINIAYLRFVAFLENEYEKSKNQIVSNYPKFELIDSISTKECYLSLKKNKFISDDTKPMDFENLFYKKVGQPVNWIASKSLLARWIYLLHNGSEKDSVSACCINRKNYFEIASKLFTHNSESITKMQLSSNNREINNKIIKQQINAAVRLLYNSKKVLHKK